MKRVMLCVAYAGTDYAGFQLQKNACTIEEVLNRTLSALCREEITVSGASRTDAGVHALGNLAVFDTDTRIPPEKIAYALNERLPEDIRIQWSKEVDSAFHPRKCRSRKSYEYRILNREMPDPNVRRNTLHYHYPLDQKAMNRAAGYFIGEHDFTSFASIHSTAKTRVRTIYEASVTEREGILVFRITGSGFLYNMVRIMAGTLILVGAGERQPEEIETILLAKNREAAGPTAPAKGLTLMGIEIENERN